MDLDVSLGALLDPAHPLLALAARLDWPQDRLMAGLHLLTLLRGLSDEDVCAQWPENPYFQAFCGETCFRRHLAAKPADLAAWRQGQDAAGLDALAAAALPPVPEKTSTFVIDVDGVVAMLTPGNDYRLSQPIAPVIAAINRLYDRGHRIVMLTARGSATGLSWEEVTSGQFAAWGLKYHELRFGKPAADYYVDDRMVSIEMMCAMAMGLEFPPSTRAPRLTEADITNEHAAHPAFG